MATFNELKKAVAAAKSEQGAVSLVSRAFAAVGALAAPAIEMARHPEAGAVRSYRWRSSPVGDIVLVAGPSVIPELHMTADLPRAEKASSAFVVAAVPMDLAGTAKRTWERAVASGVASAEASRTRAASLDAKAAKHSAAQAAKDEARAERAAAKEAAERAEAAQRAAERARAEAREEAERAERARAEAARAEAEARAAAAKPSRSRAAAAPKSTKAPHLSVVSSAPSGGSDAEIVMAAIKAAIREAKGK